MPGGHGVNAKRLSSNQPEQVTQPLPKPAGAQEARTLGSSCRSLAPYGPTQEQSPLWRDRVTQGLATVQMIPLPKSGEEGRLQKQADLGSNLCPATHRLYDLELVAEPPWAFSLSSIQ